MFTAEQTEEAEKWGQKNKSPSYVSAPIFLPKSYADFVTRYPPVGKMPAATTLLQ